MGVSVTFIPPLDLKGQYQSIQQDVSDAVLDVLSSGRYIKGPTVELFEHQFADYIGTRECIACNSGTDALLLALKALDIGPGDEVITTPFTFIATAEMISAAGATPVFVDIEADSFNLNPEAIAPAITSRTRAIIPVHLFGRPTNMTKIMAIADRHNLAVIEDCAQATGATWGDHRVGSIGHIGCFSFYPTKNLGACGDGGAVTTQDEAIAARIRKLGDHGRSGGYYHEEVGINSRLDSIQAVILSIKLQQLDQWNQQRDAAAARYQALMQAIPSIGLPQLMQQGSQVWNQYTIRLQQASQVAQDHFEAEDSTIGANLYRDRVRQHLQEQDIGSAVYYPLPLHLQPVYSALGYARGSLPHSEQAATEVLSLPMFPELTEAQQMQVTYALKDAI